MALIKCPECNKEISDLSSVCVHCGYPIKNIDRKQAIPSNTINNPSPHKDIPCRKRMSPRTLLTLIIVLGIALIVAIISIQQATKLTPTENAAIKVVGEYQDMMKDPDSLKLRSDVIIVGTYTEDTGFVEYYYFTASGDNSYNASVTSTVCYVREDKEQAFYDMDDLPTLADLQGEGDLSDEVLNAASYYAKIDLYLSAWELYGETASQELDEVSYAKTVDAKLVAKKLDIDYSK